ncbi:MAG: hypothetical protein WD076_09390 [Parvularculaceae bacterium]
MTARWTESLGLVCIAASALAACATPEEPALVAPPTPQWAGNGYLSPSSTAEPEIIGLFVTREECEEAVADWMTRQVVGNPVSGECLPIDRK